MHKVENAAVAIMSVGQPIVAATNQADSVVLNIASAISALVTERKVNGLPLGAGAAELPLMAHALFKQSEARAALIEARLGLVKVPGTLGVVGYGPECLCAGEGDAEPFNPRSQVRSSSDRSASAA